MKVNTIFKKIMCVILCVSILSLVACKPKKRGDASGENKSSDSDSSLFDESGDNSILSDSANNSTDSGSNVSKPNGSSSSIPDSSVVKSGDFVICENGQAKATIIVAKDTTDKAKSAAADLQSHIKKISGAVVKIGYDNVERTDGNFILVGPTSQTKKLGITQPTGYPGDEKVIVKRDKNYLVMIGNDDGNYRGTEFAVQTFLEELGCGWFGPDELWQVAPSQKNISVSKIDINHSPQFSSRITNVYTNYQKFSRRWYQGGNLTKQGHYLPQLVSKDVYFKTNPEWFAMVNGKRDPNAAVWWQYCYSNQDFAAEVAKKVIAEFKANPNMTQMPLTANDGWNDDWCECPTCTKLGSDTDQTIYFANNVARIVKKEFPNKKLTLLSYHSTFFPPQSNIKVDDNVEIMFCREANMTTALEEKYFVPGYDNITRNTYTQSWLDNFIAYKQKANVKHTAIWEWNCLAVERPEWENIPWVQGNTATKNQALWKRNGAEYVYYDQGPLPAYRESEDSFPLRWPLWYVSSKGMWDSSLSGDDILKDACNKLFGAASNEMFDYYKLLADSSADCKAYSICWIPPKPSEVYTKSRVAQINAAVAKIESKMSKVSDNDAKRIKSQIDYWKNSKGVIASH